MEVEETSYKKISAKIISNKQEDLISKNNFLLEFGILYFQKCDFSKATEQLEKVQSHALELHLYSNYFQSVKYLLRIFAERMEESKIQALLQEVFELGSTIPNYEQYKSKIYYNQGIYYSYARDFEKSSDSFHKAELYARECIKKSEQRREPFTEASKDLFNALCGLANISNQKENFSDAIRRYESLENLLSDPLFIEIMSDSNKSSELKSALLIGMANCYRQMGEYPKALHTFWKAHRQLKSQKTWCNYHYILLGIARTYLEMKDTDRATIFFDLVSSATSEEDFVALKQLIKQEKKKLPEHTIELLIDRERKIVLEKEKGEIHFERRFVLLEILYLLASTPGVKVTKDMLVEKVWEETYNPMVHDSKIYTSISRLRKILEPDLKHPRYILNERDGYSFNPAISVKEAGAWANEKLLQQQSKKPIYNSPIENHF